MQIYMAPMEGITGYVYRRAYHRFFNDVDKYFMPFIDARASGKFGTKERKDIAPENNEGMQAVPQILAINPESFINTARAIAQCGYEEININLGCPSGTVVSKGKGAGALADKERLRAFLTEIFDKVDMRISIKTRLGMEHPEEFYELSELFNQFPVSELIIHPRVREEYYKGTPHMDVYGNVLKSTCHRLCYNGNVFTPEDFERICASFKGTEGIMLGRGLIANPGLIGHIHGRPLKKDTLKAFCDTLYEDYRSDIPGPKNFLYKVKELWSYMGKLFTDYESYQKKIMKADDAVGYEIAVNRLFAEQELVFDVQ